MTASATISSDPTVATPNWPLAATVAFQGNPGAYGEMAALQVGHSAQGFPTFHQVFAAVAAGTTEIGVVPVENSLMGGIHQNIDLLLETDLHVVREVMVRVRHHLLALPGVELADIKRVYSQLPALQQCDGFLARHGLEAIEARDTAGAAKELAARGARDEAVIASARAGELYGLESLEAGIEDEDFNFTRFLVLSSQPLPQQPLADVAYKTSLVFAVRHTPGFLVETLGELRGLNLTKIESRPRKDRAWSYLIHIDFEGHLHSEQATKALVGVLGRASFVKVIGSYPRALEPEE
jgi:prephenate dehydratase